MVSRESLFLEGKLKTQEKSWKPQVVLKKKPPQAALASDQCLPSLGGGGAASDKTQGHLQHLWALVL